MRPKSWREFLDRWRTRWRVARRAWSSVRVHFEREPRDAWVGVYWRRRAETVESVLEKHGWFQLGAVTLNRPDRATTLVVRDRLDVWLCLVPCVPLHLSWRSSPRQRTPKWFAVSRGEANEAEGAAPESRPARTAALVN